MARHVQLLAAGGSAAEVAAACGISRVTARRYLEDLYERYLIAEPARGPESATPVGTHFPLSSRARLVLELAPAAVGHSPT